VIFGAAASLLAVELLDSGAGAAVIVVAAMVVNARHLLYSVSLAPHTRGWPRRWRWLAPYFLTDPVFAMATAHYRLAGDGDADQRLGYYVGIALTGWAGWQVATGVGVLLARTLPTALPLDLAAPLTFLLLLLPMLTDGPGYTAAAVGGTAALLASGLPLGFGILVGATAGILAGALIGRRHA
jgi:predicted branched-subunit amino acid permease